MIVPSTAIASRGAALDAILPFDRRDQLAALLTDDDLATLKHLASEGMGENTLTELGYRGLVPACNGSALPRACAGIAAPEIRRPSGGRPRSEVAGLRVDDLVDDDPVLGDPAGSWPKIRLSDRGGKPKYPAARSDAPGHCISQ